MSSIKKDSNYVTPSRYISGRIVEYDIRSANISVLRNSNYITEKDYIRLKNLPKLEREKEIGLRIKESKEVYDVIADGIKSSRDMFIKQNNINTDNIVRIANDAIYVNTPIDLQYTKFGDYIEFVPKSVSNVFVKLNQIYLFLGFRNDGNISVDVKGISDDMCRLHEPFMISSIVTTLILLERSGVVSSVNYISELCENYLHYNLPVGYYREFNAFSCYRIKDLFKEYNPFGSGTLGIDKMTEEYKYQHDIKYNNFILRELWSIIVEIYTRTVH